MKIQYLYHSGFRIETDQHLLIFDYMQGNINLAKDKNTLVFASHSHPDHYTPKIFGWQKQNPDIQYILSSDISIKENHPGQKRENIFSISPYEEIQIRDVKIKSFGSTDLGVSFLVQCEGFSIFHAGDLNWWYWWGDTPENIAEAEKLFKEEMAGIKNALLAGRKSIDLAFFPVDPRLEHNAHGGADYFIQELAPKYLIPMHFGDSIETSHLYAEKMKTPPTKIITFTKKEQEVVLEL